MQGRWKSLLEIVTAGTVVIGLALVLYELKQTRVIARTELSVQSGELLNEVFDAERSPDFSRILLKSRLTPSELTAVERQQVRAFLNKVILIYFREKYGYDLGIFETWEEYIYLTAPRYLGYGYGRAYFEVIKKQGNLGPIAETIDSAIQNADAVRFARDLDELTMRELNKLEQ